MENLIPKLISQDTVQHALCFGVHETTDQRRRTKGLGLRLGLGLGLGTIYVQYI